MQLSSKKEFIETFSNQVKYCHLFSLEAKRSSKSFNSLIVSPPEAIPWRRCSTYEQKNNKGSITNSYGISVYAFTRPFQ